MGGVAWNRKGRTSLHEDNNQYPHGALLSKWICLLADGDRLVSSDGSAPGQDGGDPPVIDPIIEGLLKRLPKTGDVWPEDDRKLWLGLLEGSFKLIYKNAAAKISRPPGDAEFRKAQGMPPHPDDEGIMG